MPGLSEHDHEFLFKHLPDVSAQATFLKTTDVDPLEWSSGSNSTDLAKAEYMEKHKASMLARIMDLRNSNADDVAFQNRKRVVLAFSAPSQPYDTGRPEVQGTLKNDLT